MVLSCPTFASRPGVGTDGAPGAGARIIAWFNYKVKEGSDNVGYSISEATTQEYVQKLVDCFKEFSLECQKAFDNDKTMFANVETMLGPMRTSYDAVYNKFFSRNSICAPPDAKKANPPQTDPNHEWSVEMKCKTWSTRPAYTYYFKYLIGVDENLPYIRALCYWHPKSKDKLKVFPWVKSFFTEDARKLPCEKYIDTIFSAKDDDDDDDDGKKK
eukprot:TRINITY_DN15733_c0_g1_i1.p1 TRINITY_DN15733_c0_g1~~TRINITY_DN15733_c0_g1_i1.p1  ORF type:complete len:247 (+),score=29.38 TRINITY_DN15733_c0_g1_i1:97-741(+)